MEVSKKISKAKETNILSGVKRPKSSDRFPSRDRCFSHETDVSAKPQTHREFDSFVKKFLKTSFKTKNYYKTQNAQ